MKKALFLLLDQFADWESAYLSATINQSNTWEVKTISLTKSVSSIGGFSVITDYQIGTFKGDYDLLIMVGGDSWNIEDESLYNFIKEAFGKDTAIGAICGAVDYLAKNGLLNDYVHTGNALYLWNEFQKYNGHQKFLEQQAVIDQNLVTANGTAIVEFLELVLILIDFDTAESIKRKIFMIRKGYYAYCKRYGNPYINGQ